MGRYNVPYRVTWEGGKVIRINFDQQTSVQTCTASKEIQEYLDGRRKAFTFPFKISGTPFEKAVYRTLMKVPYGETVSYGELARKAGYPGASRAVGNAMNKNPLAILVPCHRVIKSDGSMGGFASNTDIKAALLSLEKESKPG